MKREIMLVLGFYLMVALYGCGAEPKGEEAKAIADIEKWGGKITTAATKVDLAGTTGLAHLKGLTQLQNLGLDGTKISDTGLEHLKMLTQLQQLSIDGTEVTAQGVKKLQQALPECRTNR